ncbi:ATP-binding protein [Haladaptatus sp. YSMS36]|uniref:ATP-binding protein n=1 Tax=Haladaptatus sp. YSMS36 TaxID=3033384 RepID=UPI0023E8D902|nr:ATP-binding protein [Haladaptatus sp. YSMS36]
MTFYDRKTELATLVEEHDSPGHSFIVLYGRRRVGKTALLKEFCADRPHVYYLAAQESESRQLEKFVEQVATRYDDRLPQITDWPDAFDYVGENLAQEDLTLVIDEFPYLVDSNDSLPSYVQGFVDEVLSETNSTLILCGSSISVMESAVLSHESPLFGRRTSQLDLDPFSFRAARNVIEYSFEDAVRSYAITGGTPLYVTLFDYTTDLSSNVYNHVLSQRSILYNEPEFLLRSEVRNPGRYMSILEAIATGHSTPNEIAGATGIDVGPLSRYLQTLRRLRFIKRRIPVTESAKKSKRSIYEIDDEFLRFWFRYIEPNRSGIEEVPQVVYEKTIQPDLPRHVSVTFERICREAVWETVRRGELEPYSQVGSWWYGEDEIDIVALAPGSDQILLGECKWTNSPVGETLADELRMKAESVRWHTGGRTETYALFSKAGFTPGLRESLDDQWELFDCNRLADLLSP